MRSGHGWQARTPAAGGGWRRYLVLCAVPVVLAPLLLTGQWGQTGSTVALGYAAAVACVWRYRTERSGAGAWLWIGAGVALNASGSVAEAIQTQLLSSSATPSPADALYLGLYPCVTIGLLIIVRSRYPGLGRAKLLDAGTLVVGTGLLCWVFLIHPTVANVSGTAFAQIVQVAYPVGDLMLLAILARVMAAQGWRTPSVSLMCLGLLGFLLGDSAWAVVNDNNWSTSDVVNTLLAEPFLLGYSLLGAAALHRSAGTLATLATDDSEPTSRLLLATLTLASLIAPCILTVEALSGRVTDGFAIAVCSVLLTGLVVARMAHLLRHVQRQAARLRELSLEDELTGLPNRRALQAYLADALQRARRDRRPISLAIVDLDHFELFNDEHGHLAGDNLLKAVAAAWTSQIRGTDMVARIGGEEFVLVLPDADLDRAGDVLGKLREATPLGQTFSAGLVQWDSEALPEELLRSADATMYAAKRGGRDRVERATAPVTVS